MTTRHELLGGKVQVYRRPNSPHWQCAASVGGRQYRISSKQESLSQAKDFAEDWFLQLRGKDRFGGGLPLGKTKTFRKAAETFLEEYKALNADQRSPKYIATMEGKIKNYLNPFFGDKPVTAITEAQIVEYRIKRLKVPEPEAPSADLAEANKDKRAGPKPNRPARSTLHSEIITFGHVMQTAKRLGWVAAVPSHKAPYQASSKISHRAWFSLEEYRTLREATKKRAKHPPNPKWKWECEQLHDYILFMSKPACGPTRPHVWNLETSSSWMTTTPKRESWKSTSGANEASAIAKACRARCARLSELETVCGRCPQNYLRLLATGAKSYRLGEPGEPRLSGYEATMVGSVVGLANPWSSRVRWTGYFQPPKPNC